MLASKNSSFLHKSSLSGITATTVTNGSVDFTIPEGCVTEEIFQFVPWDNEDNLIHKEVDNITYFVLQGVFLPPLFVVSFFTNIINMIVFYKHGLKERINACLFILSLVDLLSVTVIFGYCSDVSYMFSIGKVSDLGPSVRLYMDYYLIGFYGLVTSSQMVYSVIALERCLCITRPLLVKSFMSTKTTVIVLSTMTLLVTGGYFPVAGVRYGVLCLFNPTDGSTSFLSYPKDIYFRHQLLMDFLYTILYGLLFPGLSFLCVTVCTIVTAIKLKKVSKWRESVSSASDSITSRDLAITRIIVVTSVLFIVCIAPAVVVRSSFLIVPDLKVGGRHDNLAWVLIRVYILGSVVNSTCNFFIYYISGTKFRETTQHLFSYCCRGGAENKKP